MIVSANFLVAAVGDVVVEDGRGGSARPSHPVVSADDGVHPRRDVLYHRRTTPPHPSRIRLVRRHEVDHPPRGMRDVGQKVSIEVPQWLRFGEIAPPFRAAQSGTESESECAVIQECPIRPIEMGIRLHVDMGVGERCLLVGIRRRRCRLHVVVVVVVVVVEGKVRGDVHPPGKANEILDVVGVERSERLVTTATAILVIAGQRRCLRRRRCRRR